MTFAAPRKLAGRLLRFDNMETTMAMPDISQANVYTGTYEGSQVSEAPRTIASAAGKIDAVSERLRKARAQLEQLSEVIGGPRPVSGASLGGKDRPPGGVVHRLNDGADAAHAVIDDIESLLAGISRSLG